VRIKYLWVWKHSRKKTDMGFNYTSLFAPKNGTVLLYYVLCTFGWQNVYTKQYNDCNCYGFDLKTNAFFFAVPLNDRKIIYYYYTQMFFVLFLWYNTDNFVFSSPFIFCVRFTIFITMVLHIFTVQSDKRWWKFGNYIVTG